MVMPVMTMPALAMLEDSCNVISSNCLSDGSDGRPTVVIYVLFHVDPIHRSTYPPGSIRDILSEVVIMSSRTNPHRSEKVIQFTARIIGKLGDPNYRVLQGSIFPHSLALFGTPAPVRALRHLACHPQPCFQTLLYLADSRS
jgi:hypothetical protein